MINFLFNSIKSLAEIENTIIFSLSIIPYSVFLYFIYRNKQINKTIFIGFLLTILFVIITIIFSILSLKIYGKTLVEVDVFHGAAESFLTLSDFFILFGFINLLKVLEVNNS